MSLDRAAWGNLATMRARETARALATAACLGLFACSRDGLEGEPAARNLLLITLDTTRADRLGVYGYARPSSAGIDRLASEAVVFDRAYSTSSWTLPSVVSLMTGHYPTTHRCNRDRSALTDEFVTLAETLRDAGFRTGAVVSHIYLEKRHGLEQGFDHYDQELVLSTGKMSHEAVTSPAISDKGIAWIEERARDPRARWFLWLHYFDPHIEYRAHPGVSEAFGTEEEQDRYVGEIAFTDSHLGRVLEALAEHDLQRETAVILLADHGEEFGEHGGAQHRRTLYEEVLRIPLIVRAPGIEATRVPTPVSTVDVLPTALALLGADPVSDLPGSSLVPLMLEEANVASRPVLAELNEKPIRLNAVVVDRWKLVRDLVNDQSMLFDLHSDPGEQADLCAADPERAAAMTRTLQQLMEAARQAAEEKGPPATIDLSPEDVELLENLGYAGSEDE